MGYSSKYGRRPIEYASKSAHTQIISDQEVQLFLDKCKFPNNKECIKLDENLIYHVNEEIRNPIKYIIAVDGGYDVISARKKYPSASIAFFQFGALMFRVEDLHCIEKQAFIQPEDMQKLKQIERLKLVIPIQNIIFSHEKNLTDSIRRIIFDFFFSKPYPLHEKSSNFIKTLYWLIYSEYIPIKDRESSLDEYNLSRCPCCKKRDIKLYKNMMNSNFTFTCPKCNKLIYITDVFRLHEVIDDELGANGILGYLTNLLEQMVIIDLIRTTLQKNSRLLKEILFIKDGPLAFFGQTANMHKPVRNLLNYLNTKGLTVNWVGIEKSGVFVEHASEIQDLIDRKSVFLLSNDYIYGNICPSKDNNDPYAQTSYFSGKVFYKSSSGQMYVATIPIKSPEVYHNPQIDDYMNIKIILPYLAKLKCDMYDNALFPVALANKLVSLSSHPSSNILEKFLKNKLK